MNCKKYLFPLLLILLTAVSASASMPKEWPYVRQTVNGTTIYIHFLAKDIVRVQKYPEGSEPQKKSYAVIMEQEDVWAHHSYGDGEVVGIGAGALYVSIDKTTGQLSFFTGNQLLLKEKATTLQEGKMGQSWTIGTDEDLFGLGQLRDTAMSLRGREFKIWNTNTYTPIPYFTSEKGYGVYWDNAGRSQFSCTPTGGAGEVAFTSETGQCTDYYFMYSNGTQDGLIDCIRRLTGQATMFPRWTLGHWQCRERYKTSDELASVLDRYRELGIPLDGIVQDWQYWGCDSNWNAMRFMNPYYINKVGDKAWEKYLPDDLKNLPVKEPRLKSPQEMVDYVHQHDAHLMISIWANFGPWTEPYRELKAIGALLPFDTWPRNKGVMPYDPFNPQARDIYWKYLSHLYEMGFDAWWTDSSEPDHFEKEGDDDVMTHDGPWKSVKNAFPLMHNKGIYEHQREENVKIEKGKNVNNHNSTFKIQNSKFNKRCVQMTRSGAFGLQHYATFSWSGDINASWQEMKKQVPSGLNYSLCGIPFWNTDIGGFFYWDYKNDPKNPKLQELHSRWMQWGTFMPLMRNHASSPMVSELYHFGQKGEWAYDVQVDAIKLRYRLLPYIYSMAGEVVQHSGSMMRALVMDFADDKRAIRLNDEYMFGPNLLVKPVSDPSKAGPGQPTDVEVYLPKGKVPVLETMYKKPSLRRYTDVKWYDFYTNRLYDGGQAISRSTPISEMPVYVKAGSILPFGPEVQYNDEKALDNLEIRIYPGSDGRFTLYEDEGDNYNYEQGAFTEINFYWDDARRSLLIAGRTGKFKGMLKKRQFRIVIVDSQSSRGDQPMTGGRVVEYKGKKTEIRF